MRPKAPKPRAHPAIEAFLSAPVGRFGLAELPNFWRVTRITFVFERPPDLDDGVRLPAAIRGALGEPLKVVSRERYSDDAPLGTPFHAFFADHCMFSERWHVPKPFVIWCHSADQRIYIEVSLFGEAGIWRDDVIEAMLRVMHPVEKGGEGGVSLMPGSRARRIWKLRDIFWRERGGFPIPPIRKQFLFTSKTPMIMSGQTIMRSETPQLFFSIFARLAGLARWHGIEAADDLAFSSIRAACRAIRTEVLFEPRPSLQQRYSRTFRTRGRSEAGLYLTVLVRAFPDELWPGFVLGTLSHAGYDVVQGYGRYAIGYP